MERDYDYILDEQEQKRNGPESWIKNLDERSIIIALIILVVGVFFFTFAGLDKSVKIVIVIVLGGIILMAISRSKQDDYMISDYEGLQIITAELERRKREFKKRFNIVRDEDYVWEFTGPSRIEWDAPHETPLGRVYEIVFIVRGLKKYFIARVGRSGSYNGILVGRLKDQDKVLYLLPPGVKEYKRLN